jgi:hypothetical protein
MSDCGPEDRLSFEEMLGYFQVERRAGHRWVKSGDIDSFKAGRRRYFTVEQVVAFELKGGRFDSTQREQLADQVKSSVRDYLQRRRNVGLSSADLAELIRRVERIEKVLENQFGTRAAA